MQEKYLQERIRRFDAGHMLIFTKVAEWGVWSRVCWLGGGEDALGVAVERLRGGQVGSSSGDHVEKGGLCGRGLVVARFFDLRRT